VVDLKTAVDMFLAIWEAPQNCAHQKGDIEYLRILGVSLQNRRRPGVWDLCTPDYERGDDFSRFIIGQLLFYSAWMHFCFIVGMLVKPSSPASRQTSKLGMRVRCTS
jgi:hypothetical protein